MKLAIWLTIVVAVLTQSESSGQTAPGPPAFEVASVKPSIPGRGMIGMLTYPGGRILIGNSTLEMLIEDAFDVRAFQVSGGPGWIHEDRYEIEARPPASSKSSKTKPISFKAPPNEEQRQMLQTLLEDRFQLRFHREIKDGSVYLLVRGNKDLKLEDAIEKSDFSWVGSPQGGMIAGDGIAGENISMPVLATRLSSYLGRPVLDRTGLDGFFNFKFVYDSGDTKPDVISSIFISVQEIGLKLEGARGPVESIVVDEAKRPSAN